MKHRAMGKDVRWGAGWGLFGGLVYLGFAAVVIVLKNAADASVSERINVPVLLSMYPILGVVAGCIMGLLRPLLKTRRGAMLVGIVAAFPTMVSFLWFVKGPFWAWGGVGWFSAFGSAILLGSMGGYILWGQLYHFDPEAFLRAHERHEPMLRRKKERKKKRKGDRTPPP